MNYINQLTDDEIQYVCSVIPLQETKQYFQHNPREFTKIMRGFRASSLSQEKAEAVLFNGYKNPFISSFIERHIVRWLEEIKKQITLKMKNNEDKALAILQTLPNSFFAKNIKLYFKLTGEEYSEEYIAFLSVCINFIQDMDKKQNELESLVNDNKNNLSKAQEEYDKNLSKFVQTKAEISNLLGKIKIIENTLTDYDAVKDILTNQISTVETLKNNELGNENRINQLTLELSLVNNKVLALENKIVADTELSKGKQNYDSKVSCLPLRPENMFDFKNSLGYNLENSGLCRSSDCFSLLLEYLCDILFLGIPIVVGYKVSLSLTKYISNTLVGTTDIDRLAFSSELTCENIEQFLSNAGRIVCLDNFIGNYNETVLLELCCRHKNKILFFTVKYERTLYYVPHEFFKYCAYLNINRLNAFATDALITEAPTIFEECESFNKINRNDSKWKTYFDTILAELSFEKSVSLHKSLLVYDEPSCLRILAFDILPYCVDVLQISPCSLSESLTDYIRKCRYKNLFKEWFFNA